MTTMMTNQPISAARLALPGLDNPLGGLQQALQGIQQTIQGLSQLLKPLEQALQNPLGAALSAAGQGVNKALGGLDQALGSPLGGIGQALGGVGQALGGLSQALGGVTQGLQNPMAQLGQLGQGLGQALGQGLGQALGQGLGQALGQGLGQALGQDLAQGVKQGQAALDQAIGGMRQASKNGADSAVMESLHKIIEELGGALGAAGDLANKLKSGALGSAGGSGPMNGDKATAEIGKAMLGSGMTKLTGKDLEDAANGIRPKGMKPEDFTQGFQEAAKFLKSDAGKATMDKLDTADADNAGKGIFKGKTDGTIGIGDVSAALQKTGLDAGQRETIGKLRENFNALSKDGHTFDMDTLKNVAQGKAMPDGNMPGADLVKAAKALLNDPALAFATDNALKSSEGKFDQRGDGKISVADLNKTLAR